MGTCSRLSPGPVAVTEPETKPAEVSVPLRLNRSTSNIHSTPNVDRFLQLGRVGMYSWPAQSLGPLPLAGDRPGGATALGAALSDQKGIFHLQSLDDSAMLEIFCIEHCRSARQGGFNNQRIPK